MPGLLFHITRPPLFI